MIATGLDRLLAAPDRLAGRRYGLLAHHASVTADLRPAHRALAGCGAGELLALYGPEHGYHGVEQDMVAVDSGREPLSGLPLASLYGDSEQSLRPAPEAFDGLDLLLVDLQDVGSRYYTYAATAVWSAEAARRAGCEVWILDRPNPLGGEIIEGNLPEEGFESFVGAFPVPVRHGLTLGELVGFEAGRRGWDDGVSVWPMAGWRRGMEWPDTARPWLAPSPNMPAHATAQVYPGSCLFEATELSEGRGTTRPFQWIGAPGVEPRDLVEALAARSLPGVAFLPLYFRPQFHKHAGQLCGGIELVVTDPATFRPVRTGVELLAAWRRVAPESFSWREAPYEFVTERPAVDLLAGSDALRRLLEEDRDPGERLDALLAGWQTDERQFEEMRRGWLLYGREEES